MDKTYKHLIAVLSGVLFCVTLSAQLNFDFTQGKFLVKGRVIDQQTGNPVPLTNIQILNRDKGITCDDKGKFDLYVYKTDSLKF